MLGVRRPKAYKAVVSVAGPSDLSLMLHSERNTFDATEPGFLYWTKSIGDLDKDRDMLRQASPSERADEMGAPVLLIHGKRDNTVPIDQSRTMAQALRKANKPVEIMEMEVMAHSPDDLEDNIKVFEKIVEFIKPKFA